MKVRLVRAWEGIWPTLVLWLPICSLFLLSNSEFPDRYNAKQTVAIFVLLIEFLLMLGVLMRRGFGRTKEGKIDFLAVSLISAVFALALGFLVSLALYVNPQWVTENPGPARQLQNAARIPIAISMLWAIIQFLSVPPARAEDRISTKGLVITYLLVLQLVIVYGYVSLDWRSWDFPWIEPRVPDLTPLERAIATLRSIFS